jgi:hypothetical protein
MTLFILGFICCWIVFAVLQLFAEKYDWNCHDWYIWLTTAPISIPVVIMWFLLMLIYNPWRNVIHSVSQYTFNAEVSRGNLKVLHIWHFKICYDTDAKLLNRLFFVKIKK